MGDGTAVSGEMMAFEKGYFRLKTRSGTLVIAAGQVRKITRIDALPPEPEKRQLDPQAVQRVGKLLSLSFLKGFDRDPFPKPFQQKFEIIAVIARVGQRYGNPTAAFDVIDAARRHPKAKTGERRCVLVACEVVAHAMLGGTEKARAKRKELPDRGVGKDVRDELDRFLGRQDKEPERLGR